MFKHIKYWIFLFSLVFSVFLLPTWLLSKELKKVLIIHSYNAGFEWTDGVQAGIVDTLKTNRELELYTEYMDLIRNPSSEEYLNTLERLYEIRYKTIEKRPDIIIIVDDDAFNFFLKKRDVLFKGIPVVFCGINDFDKARIKGLKNLTGVNEKKSIKETIELALSLSKDPKKIGVIAGERLSEKINLTQFKKDINTIRHNQDTVYLNGYELDDIKKIISKFDKDDIIIFLSYLITPSGKVYTMDEVLKAIIGSTKAKVYGTSDIQIKHGVIGGKVVYSFAQGEEAAKMVLKILKGEAPDKIPIKMESPNRYLFDGEALKRHGISLSQLPKNTIIINRTSEQLVMEWRDLIKSSRLFSYEFFLNHGTVMLIIDPSTGTILDANVQAKLFYGYPVLVGKKIQEINTLTEEEIKREMEKAKAVRKNFFNFRHRLSNGDIRDVEVYSYPIMINNRPLLFSIVFDVTEKLKAQNLKAERDRMLIFFFVGIIFAALCFITLMFFYNKKIKSYLKDLTEQNKRLEEAQAQIKTLTGIIPICMYCKKIRDDQGYWSQLENFISAHSDAVFSHSLCPECKEKYYKDMIKK